MSFLKGRLTTTSFLTEIVDLTSDKREALTRQLQHMSFKGLQTETQVESVGFIPLLMEDGSSVDFSNPNTWLINGVALVALGLRTDSKQIPADTLKRMVNARCRTWCENRETERCPASIRKEIREHVKESLLRRAIPRTQVVEIIWYPTRGLVLVDTRTKGRLDKVRKHMDRGVGLELHPRSPLDALRDTDLRDALLSTTPFTISKAS